MPQPIPTVLGAIERTKDERDFPLGAAQVPTPRPPVFIPDISWLTRNYQGSTPYCGAHALSHLKAILDRTRYTPRYSWIKIKAIDGYPLATGTDMRSIFKATQANGTNDFSPLLNDVTLPIDEYSAPATITPEYDANAKPKAIESYAFGETDYASLCQYIFQNKAVLLLIKCDEGFWGTETPTFTTAKYGHFIVAYGYDENGIYVIDSADPDDTHAFKFIAKQYITPQFILESGTAVDVPPSVKHALSAQQISLAQAILADIQQAIGLVRKEAGLA